MVIQFCSRSRTIFEVHGKDYASMKRVSVAVAWRQIPDKEWRSMASCPIPEQPGSGWSLLSKKWENTELAEIPR